jgi:PAS domain S-box-containing protein
MSHGPGHDQAPTPSTTARAEQALRDSEARLRAIVDTAVDGILTIDEAGAIEWLNAAALRIFGYAAEELVGRNVKLLMPDPYHAEHDRYLDNYRRTGERKIIGIGREVLGQRKDGSTFPCDLAVSEVHLGDRRIFTGIIRDITQRKRGEQELLTAKDAAETASRAKDQFIAAVSHELRTPLNPIQAVTNLLLERPDLPQAVREDLHVIRRNVEQEARLVDDLLNLTRLSRGKIELHHEVVDVHALLRAVVGQYQDQIDRKRIDLLTGLRARNSRVWADPGRLQQILANLIDNAVKFTPESGGITVRTADVEPARVRIEISDTGIGIEPDVLPRLFSPFEQGEKSVTRRYGGLGLGLVISKGLVELHHGTLRARSEGQGKGSTFTLELPVTSTAPVLSGPRRAAAPAAGIKCRVLLVEDHADTLYLMARILGGFGCEVTTAANATEAIAAARRQRFDLLVSDIGLPDGSGLDVMRQVKAEQGIAGIALSGYGQDDDKRRSREAGFTEHLVKPVNFQILHDVIKRFAS